MTPKMILKAGTLCVELEGIKLEGMNSIASPPPDLRWRGIGSSSCFIEPDF